MGQTTRSEWENDMKAHRELLRNVIEEHREGREASMDWSDMITELQFEEEKVYAPVSALSTSSPPSIVKGDSGWIYHSTSYGCLRPYHFPRRLAINVVESAVFDPFILCTIMVNCTTMAWSSPMDPPGTKKQELLAVRNQLPIGIRPPASLRSRRPPPHAYATSVMAHGPTREARARSHPPRAHHPSSLAPLGRCLSGCTCTFLLSSW